jgi:hypothetical protein
MSTPKRMVFFYKHDVVSTVGQSYASEALLNRERKQIGIITSNKVCPQTSSTDEGYEFMPYITNKTIITKNGVLVIMYMVLNKNVAHCKILIQQGEFANVKKVTRVVLPNTSSTRVYGQFILEM